MLRNDFKVELYASFKSKVECYGYDIIADLQKISKNYGLNIFDCVIRYTNNETEDVLQSTKSYFDFNFISGKL